MYSDDAAVLDEDVQSIRKNMEEYLKSYAENAAQSEAYSKWLEKYPYTIEYELLKIDPPAETDNVSLEDEAEQQ